MIKKVLLPFLFFFLFTSNVFAQTTVVINDFSQQVEVGQEFEITFSATELSPDIQYYAKIRVGVDSSHLNQAETYNPNMSSWFSDTSSWSNFPIILSNSLGNIEETIKARTKQTVSLGQNKLILRLRKVNVDPNIDSSEIEITLIEAPTPTNTPTLIPTQIPSATSTPTVLLSPTPTQTQVSVSNIFLSEFIPNPESGFEKVEIYNDNDFSVNLNNWKIDDVENSGHSPKDFNAQIPAKNYYVIDLDSNSFLNNDSDDVRLLDFNGSEKDKKSYSNPPKGKSYAKDSGGDWCWQESSFNSSNNGCIVITNTPTETSVPVSLTPTQTTTSVPTITLTKTPTLIATTSGEIKNTEDEKILGTNITKEINSLSKNNNKSNSNKLFFIPIALGIGFLGFSTYQMVKSKVK
jgi:hypothetical protein